MSELRNALVQIGETDEGMPSLKIDGREHNMLIGKEIVLRHIDDADNGHWELTVTYVEPDVEVDVVAQVNSA